MSNYTHHTAPTQFVEANGIRFAYRRFGKKQGLPLVFNPHLLGNLDSWDPAVTDGLAREREVIVSNDRVISPTLEATMAAKMKATTITLQSGHLSMLSHTAEVTAFVEKAATSLKP